MTARSLTPKEEMRLFAGLAVQPFLAAAVSVLSFALVFPGRLTRTHDPAEAAFGLALYMGYAALLMTIFCVLPTTVWVVKRIRVSFVQALAWGFAFANLPFALITIANDHGDSDLLKQHGLFTLIGLVGAAAFWAIAIRGKDLSRDPPMEDRTPED
jgi:hypothetical protein